MDKSSLYRYINSMKIPTEIKRRIEHHITCDLITEPEEVKLFIMKANRKSRAF